MIKTIKYAPRQIIISVDNMYTGVTGTCSVLFSPDIIKTRQ